MSTADPSLNSHPSPLRPVAVIGAGPAGLAAAYRLQLSGVQVDLYESQAQVGGLCRSFDLWGQAVDLGPHRFFSSNEDVNRFWFQAAGEHFSWVPRQTRIFYKQKYFEYPLQAWSTFANLGWKESFLSLVSYAAQKFSLSSDESTFEKWVVRRFGRRLYTIFFKTYSEKLWGLPCDQIDPDFAYRKIRKLSVFEVFKRFFKNNQTFVDSFAYPHHGTGVVYQTIADRFQKSGGVLKLNTSVEQIAKVGGQFRVSANGQHHHYDHVISTMPLTVLMKQFSHVPEDVLAASQALSFRHTILVYLWMEGENLFPDNWIYVHSPDVRFGRVTNFNNWSPTAKKSRCGTVICLEYWCSTEDDIWSWTEEQMGVFAQKEWRTSKIAPNCGTIQDFKVIKLPRSYPVFKVGYKQHLSVIKNYLKKNHPQICTIGRYGAFKYNNQDHSILMGLRAASLYLRQSKEETESVNSDHNYEEDFELADVRYDAFDEV